MTQRPLRMVEGMTQRPLRMVEGMTQRPLRMVEGMTQRPLRMVGGFQHRRGLSDGSVLQDRDEDLALFQDMRTPKNNDSLNPSTDEIDESLSRRLRGLSDTSTQTRKNEYNWLLTPPGTPLFPSLKQDAPRVNISEKGTLQTGVISRPQISSRTTTRGNSSSPISRSRASPRWVSTASYSSGLNTYSRGRTSSIQSGNPKLQSLTSSGRPATSIQRSSSPSAKSLTTALQRSSTSSCGQLSSVGRGGYSPEKNRHGRSASPKIQPWQSGIPSFSPEPPPNLRTTLSERSTSRLRGLSPASRHGEETVNKPRGQSISPRISRLSNSLNNHDSDRLSSHSKSSVVSSCEDETDSNYSAISVKKITHTKSTVHGQVTRKKGSNTNIEVQLASKKQVKPTSKIVSSGSGSTVQQPHLRQNSKSMFRPLLSSAPAASFYTYKTNNFLHQASSINSSVTTSSNASSEQGARVAPYTEAGDQDIGDVKNEPGKCLTLLCPTEISAFDKTEIQFEDTERQSVGSCSLSQEHRDCLDIELTSDIQDLCIDSYEQSPVTKICEDGITNPDTGNLGKRLLDSNESVKSIPGVTSAHGYDCHQDVDTGHTQKDEQEAEIDEHREVCLYFKKDIIYSNDESLGNPIVDIQEDKSLKSMSIKNVSDGISENLQAALQRDFEIAKMQKHDLESRKYVIMHEATKNQIMYTNLLQPYCSVDCHTTCLKDQLSDGQMTGSNNMNLMSKRKEVKGIAHCECGGNIQHQTESVDFPLQHMSGKDALEHKVELFPECVASRELASKVKTAKESVLQVEAVSSINLWRDYFYHRSSGNDLMKSVVYGTDDSVPGASSIEQTGTSDLCQASGRKIDLENITSTSCVNVLSGLSNLSAEGERSKYQTPVCSEKKVSIDYFLDILEMPSTMETNTLDHTASKNLSHNLLNSTGISSINMVYDLNSAHAGARNKTHHAPIYSENASGNPCTNYCLDVSEMTSTVETETLKHTVAASKGLTDELRDITSISSLDMSGVSIPTTKVQNNAHQTPGHIENVSEKTYVEYCPDVFEITRTFKTKTLEHSAAALKSVSIPTAKVQNNAHQTPGHIEKVSEKAYIDYCPDIFELTRTVKTKTLEHSAAASKGLPDGIQGGDLLSLPEEVSVCVSKEVILPVPGSNLVSEVNVKINKDPEVEITNKKKNMLCNDASSPEKQNQRYACIDSFEQYEKSGNFYVEIQSNVVRDANKLAAGSPEQEMKSTIDNGLQTDMTNCSIQASPDSIVLNEDEIADEKKVDGLHEIEIKIQPEVAASTNDLTILQTDEGPSASATSERYKCNQNDDVEPKYPSYHDNPGHAHDSQGNSGVNTDAPKASLSRSPTLAEATDSVLFCGTIVHNLIDKAANIGMEKENVIAVGNPSTNATFLAMPAAVQRSLSVSAAAPHSSFKPKKTKSRQAITGHRVRSNNFDNNIKDGERVLQVIVIPQRDAIAHARKRKCKCCCTIM